MSLHLVGAVDLRRTGKGRALSWWITNRVYHPSIDPHGEVNVLSENEDGFWFNTNRVARKSWKRAERWGNPRTVVNACEVCSLLGTPRRVTERSDCYRAALFGIRRSADYAAPMLCTGCWNKVRAFVRRWDQLQELRSVAKRIQRGDFRDGQQDHRRSA